MSSHFRSQNLVPINSEKLGNKLQLLNSDTKVTDDNFHQYKNEIRK
jgi:hypothetical protein